MRGRCAGWGKSAGRSGRERLPRAAPARFISGASTRGEVLLPLDHHLVQVVAGRRLYLVGSGNLAKASFSAFVTHTANSGDAGCLRSMDRFEVFSPTATTSARDCAEASLASRFRFHLSSSVSRGSVSSTGF